MGAFADLETAGLHHERGRLRAENERLNKLLEISDGEAQPAPEQAAAAIGSQ